MLLAFLLTACGVGGPPCGAEKLAELPIVFLLRVPYVRVAINGRPATMLIDTGANVSVLTPAAAARLGVAAAEVQASMSSVSGPSVARAGQVREMQIGPVRVPGVIVAITDVLRMPGDGVIGLDVLAGFQVELDSPARRISFFSPPACRNAHPDWAGPVQEIEAARLWAGYLTVPITVNGTTMRAVLDTGASITVVSRKRAQSLGLAVVEPPRIPGMARPPVGLFVSTAALRDLRVGELKAKVPVVGVADLPDVGADALVGNDYLVQRRAWFAFNPPRVFLTDQPRPR